MDLNEIQDLIKFVSKSGVSMVEIERKDFKITIKADPNWKKGRGTSGQQDSSHLQVLNPMPQNVQPMLVQQQAQPLATQVSEAAVVKSTTLEVDAKYVTFKSPMIGTFYRSAGPDKDPFVSIGDDISAGKVLCIIEAMKLFNEIEAEISGKIVKILVDDATPVEYDQPLFLIDPS